MNRKILTIIVRLFTALVIVGSFGLVFLGANMENFSAQLEERIKAATIPGNISDEKLSSGAPFNMYGKLRYSDLSQDLRKRITKEEFESIVNYFDAQKVFNKTYKEVIPFPKNGYRLTQPILVGTIYFEGKKYYINHKIAIGYEHYVKPVIIEWYMEIEPYEN